MVWAMKQQVVSMLTAECELYAATTSEVLGILILDKDLRIVCGLNLRLGAAATMCQVNRRELGKAKHVDASKSGRFVAKKLGANVNFIDLRTKPLPRPKFEQFMMLMECQLMENDQVKTNNETHSVRDEINQTLDKCVEPQARGATCKTCAA